MPLETLGAGFAGAEGLYSSFFSSTTAGWGFVSMISFASFFFIAGLLEVVETFRQRFTETARRTDAGYLVSALNILNEAEINFRSARNKRLHVELALIKLCYLQQALQLIGNAGGVDKKKVIESARSVAFRAIAPIPVTLFF